MTGKECTKIQNALAQPLFLLIKLWFGDVCVRVAVVVCLSSLLRSFVTFAVRILSVHNLWRNLARPRARAH